jgi:hypothetical protein
MRRNLLGIIAALLLVVGVISAFGGPGGETAQQFSGVCVKSGLVLGALWLALPQILSMLKSTPRWLLGWFSGKNKSPSSKDTPQVPAARPPRPRRRSNA